MPTGPEIPNAVEAHPAEWVAVINARLNELLPLETEVPERLHAAMRYSALAPGKRLRPLLCLGFAELTGGDALVALDAACAIEMVHAFSLIHDDLPAIDNDDLRRGRPTLHRQFDEATAILAGDALFALAFAVLARQSDSEALRHLAEAALRLVRGETQDILSEGHAVSAETLAFIHQNKTGALIAASCEIGVRLAQGSEAELSAARNYGAALGLAFQIADDILNVEGDPAQLGKAVGSDAERKKATYPAVFGLPAAKAEARRLAQLAEDQLQVFPRDARVLANLARFSVERIF